MDTQTLTISHALDALGRGTFTPQDLAEACFAQINRLNPTLNAYITVIPPQEALEAQQPPLITAPLYRALRGIPIAVKDLFDVEGIRTTAGSKFFANHIAERDAFVVEKLRRAGALINGKTNMHEIALGVTNNNPHFGACKNPWDVTRTPGGSSGGSAVAVATGMALAALGTDTGGSIRIPAALCGVVGLKPTYGRVSLRGVIPLSWNLDHAGPITRRVEDAAVMLQVMDGYDEQDPASKKTLPGDYSSHLQDSIKGRRAALAVGRFIEEATDPQVLQSVRRAAETLEEQGMTVSELNMDFLRDAALANGLMVQADAAAFHRERLKEHAEWFGADVRQRLETGAAFTAIEYTLARRTQTETKRRLASLFEEYDVILLPTTPIPAPVLEGEDAVERARLLTRFTAPFNLTGLPALSVPCGFSSEGLPIGLQIVARAWNEAGALRAGCAYQQATEWHTMQPKIAAV